MGPGIGGGVGEGGRMQGHQEMVSFWSSGSRGPGKGGEALEMKNLPLFPRLALLFLWVYGSGGAGLKSLGPFNNYSCFPNSLPLLIVY